MFKFFSLFFSVKASKSLINFCDYQKKKKKKPKPLMCTTQISLEPKGYLWELVHM